MRSSTNNEAIKNCEKKYNNDNRAYNDCIRNIKLIPNTVRLKGNEEINKINSTLIKKELFTPPSALIEEDCETKLNKILNIIANKEEETNNSYMIRRSNTTSILTEKIKQIEQVITGDRIRGGKANKKKTKKQPKRKTKKNGTIKTKKEINKTYKK